jgi:hypothetical protein
MVYLIAPSLRPNSAAEAEILNRDALAKRKKVLGPTHPDTLMSLYCPAHLLGNRDHYNESVLLYRKACAAWANVLGNDHPITYACDQKRLSCRSKIGVPMHQTAMQICQPPCGP